MIRIEYAPGLQEANYTVITPYLVPPGGAKRVNVGDGFILDSATRLLGVRPTAAFSSRLPLSDSAIERINASSCVVAIGANTLKDQFEITPGFTAATLARIKVPIVLMGVGHYGVAEVTRGLSRESVNLFRAILERFPLMSVRCDASRRYVAQSLPDLADRVVMTSCPVVHQVDGVDKGFTRRERYACAVVSITDRQGLAQQLPILKSARQAFAADEWVLALHQDYGNRELWGVADRLGYRVERSVNHQEFLRLYARADLHIGNRVHAHLKCLSLGVITFCMPFDLRQKYFSESLDFPLLNQLPDPRVVQYDFSRARTCRDLARRAMDDFTSRLRREIDAGSKRSARFGAPRLLRSVQSFLGRG